MKYNQISQSKQVSLVQMHKKPPFQKEIMAENNTVIASNGAVGSAVESQIFNISKYLR